MASVQKKHEMLRARHVRVRRKVAGTPERPRLAVYKSGRHIYAQIVDDAKGHTLASAGTLTPSIREEVKKLKPIERAKLVGTTVAKMAKEKGIQAVVFDRGGFPFMGRVKALAEAARAAGLKF